MDYHYATPIKTAEGILDWKNIDWILHTENKGIVHNIPLSLGKIIHDSGSFEHRCFYEKEQLVKDEFFEIDEKIKYLTDRSILVEQILGK